MFVFDTCSLMKLHGFNREVFHSLWSNFEQILLDGEATSTREVLAETARRDDSLKEWCSSLDGFFVMPDEQEVAYVGEIFSVPQFLGNMPKQTFLTSNPFADPYVVARARRLNGTVVTEEKAKMNSGAKIPTICKHFGIDCTDLDGFMLLNGWKF